MPTIAASDLAIAGVDGATIEPLKLIALLTSVDVDADRSDFDALEIVAGWEKVRAWVEAQSARALADFVRRPETFGSTTGRPPAPLGACLRSHPGEELAVRCGISISSAGHRVGSAMALADRHHATWTALNAAAIDGARAAFLMQACIDLDDTGAKAVEVAVLHRSAELDAPRWRAAVRREAIAVDPRSARQRHERAQQDRQVRVRAVENGMAELWALLPAEAALAIATALDARARSIRAGGSSAKDHGAADVGSRESSHSSGESRTLDASRTLGESRTLDQLRADVLVEVFEHALRTGELIGSGPLGEHGGHRAHLHVTVPLSVLLGIDDSPGFLAGYGPITAETAREIATDATWRRVLTDPATGDVLEVGTTTYRPPAVLQRHIETRDGTCRFPGCTRMSERCDVDHTVPYPTGATDASNLGALCRRHHRLKHGSSATGTADGRTRLRQSQPGVFTWMLPTGSTATVTPDRSIHGDGASDALIKRLREAARKAGPRAA